MLPNKRRAIVRLDTHANAATAIIALQDTMIAGNKVRLRWAKEERQEQTDSPTRSFNVFSSGYEHPKELVNQITNTYENHTTTRPPAPTFDASMDTEEGLHGWNQYYQQYYSAGHITI
ncbi:hypothetical protein CU098_004677 [Rhizopus stolonifer]|uniref:RRM domain-containing protein n=2 Tax=Mucorineae TaxID=1344963 RepID=A0A367ILI1_RHIST|nr:hypothetical protein CU098_004677 [Rhizopus stolonifer]